MCRPTAGRPGRTRTTPPLSSTTSRRPTTFPIGCAAPSKTTPACAGRAAGPAGSIARSGTTWRASRATSRPGLTTPTSATAATTRAFWRGWTTRPACGIPSIPGPTVPTGTRPEKGSSAGGVAVTERRALGRVGRRLGARHARRGQDLDGRDAARRRAVHPGVDHRGVALRARNGLPRGEPLPARRHGALHLSDERLRAQLEQDREGDSRNRVRARGAGRPDAPRSAVRGHRARGVGGRLRRRWVGRAPRREKPAARRDDLLLAQEQEPGREARHPRRGWPADPELQ